MHIWLLTSSYGIMFAILSFLDELGYLTTLKQQSNAAKGALAVSAGIVFYLAVGRRQLEGRLVWKVMPECRSLLCFPLHLEPPGKSRRPSPVCFYITVHYLTRTCHRCGKSADGRTLRRGRDVLLREVRPPVARLDAAQGHWGAWHLGLRR